jgi:hypothetical protein
MTATVERERRFGVSLPMLATILAVLVMVLAAALIPLLVLSRQSVSSNADQLADFLPMTAAGWIIARRATRSAGCCLPRQPWNSSPAMRDRARGLNSAVPRASGSGRWRRPGG